MGNTAVDEAVPVAPAPVVAQPGTTQPDNKDQSPKAKSGERRRPGRMEYANPALISLLRKPTAPVDELAINGDETEGGILRGLVFALPIGIAMWAVFGLVVWFLWPW